MSPQTVPHGRYADQPIEDVPEHHAEWMVAMNTSVADKIAALLERTDKLKRGSSLKHTRFDQRGEREARRIAAADGVVAKRPEGAPPNGSSDTPGGAGSGTGYRATFVDAAPNPRP